MALTLRGYYAILDVQPGGPLAAAGAALAHAEKLLSAGPCALQLRAKGTEAGARLPDGEVVALGRALRPLCHARGVFLCMNDRVDLALLVGADLVHLGQDDLPTAVAREVLARVAVEGETEPAATARALRIGVSTHDLVQARAAARDGADYLGFGPVFATASKANPDPVVGVERLREVVAAVPLPVVAIGGITLDNVGAVAAAGAHAAAVIGAVQHAADPAIAARAIAAVFASRS